jgi:toxic protein SymE
MVKDRIRKVKLHGKYRPLQSCGWPNFKAVPWLNVSGQWLEQAGFKVGDAVEITVEQSTLIIKNLHGDGDTRD